MPSPQEQNPDVDREPDEAQEPSGQPSPMGLGSRCGEGPHRGSTPLEGVWPWDSRQGPHGVVFDLEGVQVTDTSLTMVTGRPNIDGGVSDEDQHLTQARLNTQVSGNK